MPHLCWAAVLALPLLVRAAPAADAAELEQAVQEAIRKAEPSIACILVSRSNLYRPFNPPPGADDLPGRLGGFDLDLLVASGKVEKAREKQLRTLDLSNPETVPESYGSGVVIDPSGLVLTNAHVVHGATKVYVRLPNGTGSWADVHALDPRSDLAVLRLIRPLKDLKALKPGDGNNLRKGQFVVALANPFAVGAHDGSPSASFGIVSNLRRRTPGYSSETERNRLTLQQFGILVETDARLNLGCSGGALLNLKGEWIGLTTARAGLVGVETPGGFALPLDEGVQRIIEVLRRGEEVEYGFVGIKFHTDIPGAVRIQKPIDRSPAHVAGLRDGDYILSVDGVPVRHPDDVFLAIGTRLCGSMVVIEHADQPQGPGRKTKVTLAKYYVPKPPLASRRPPAACGLRVEHASVAVQQGGGRQNESIPEGVLIREVVPGSAAERAKLQADKIITHVKGQPVNSPAEFYAAMKTVQGDVELHLAKPDGGSVRVTLQVD